MTSTTSMESMPKEPSSLSIISAYDRLTPAAKENAEDTMERLIALRKADSTDQAPTQWREPARSYIDEDLFKREIETIHKQLPLPLALSAELAKPNSYKAMNVAGVPVLITRDSKGQIHAMINSCRHRGAQLAEVGLGTARRFTCPYHAWTYGVDGCLRGVYGESTTGPIDKENMGLVTLPAEERAGIVFVGLTPSLTWDLDDWLGGYLPLLEGMNLAECHHWSMNTLPGPNWKVALDGYLEGYHFSTVHRDTVFRTTHSNCAAFDAWGPHVRSAFALKAIDEVGDLPREEWDPSMTVGSAAVIFPGLSIAGGWRDQIAVSIVMPGTNVGESITQQHILLRDKPADDVEEKEATITSEWFHEVVTDEDYALNFSVQEAVRGATEETEFVFMQNEPGVQHFHRMIDAMVSGVPSHPVSGLEGHHPDNEIRID